MVKRKIIEIDEEKCNGCGLCIPACPEGALQIIGGKARLVSEIYCDGLGACLGQCPQGAIRIVEREAEEFDEEAVKKHLQEIEKQKIHQETHNHLSACPSAQVLDIGKEAKEEKSKIKLSSSLSNWPIQLTLVPINAPYLKNASLLIAADCVPFSYANFHTDFLEGKTLLISCPKLDDAQFYKEKLTQIFAENNIKDLTVVTMEVPCCQGLSHITKEAVKIAEKEIPLKEIIITIKGEIKNG